MSKLQEGIINIIDDITGEILSSSTFSKKIPEKSFIKFKPQSKFTKLFSYIEPPFSNDPFQLYFYRLMHSAQQFTNIIVAKRNGFNIHADKKLISKMLDKSERTIERFIKEAISIGAITKVDGGAFSGYVINPAYAYNGYGIDPFLFLIFEKNEAFISSLTRKNIQEYYSYTKTDFAKSIKKNFPEIYQKRFEKKVFVGA